MDPTSEEKVALPSEAGKSSGADLGGSSQVLAKAITLGPIVAGFDLASVRCATESRLHDLIWKNEDLLGRMKALTRDKDEASVQERLSLITDAYRVDEAITPRLFHLGVMLTRVLRLARPLDIFVRSDHEMNAFCVPSRKGNRLVMCLHSGLVDALGSQELLFCMGHEVGHALLKHGDTLGVSFDNPDFSPVEVVRLRALDRAQEVSCDRIGLLVCQDVRLASLVLFRICSGLAEKWISFDEGAYARQFDELSSMAELVDLDADAHRRTHPFDPLRAKALVAFSKSETYAKAFGRTAATISTGELEKGVEMMLSVLDPDLTELENAKEEEAANQFLMNGALKIIAADGLVEPHRVAWLKAHFDTKWSRKDVADKLSTPEFQEQLDQELKSSAHILVSKVPETKLADLLHVMCDVALCGGGLPDTEMAALNGLRQLLSIRPEIAEEVLQDSKKEHEKPAEAAGHRAGLRQARRQS